MAANVLKHGTGALNIDACRVGISSGGRWPANLIFEHHPTCQLLGTKKVSGGPWGRKKSTSHAPSCYQSNLTRPIDNSQYTDEEGLETVDAWHCTPGCPVAALDDQSVSSRFFKLVGGSKTEK